MIFKIFLLAGVFGLIVSLCALASMLVLDLCERIAGHPVKDCNLLRETSFAKQKVMYYEIVGECQIKATNTPGVLYRDTSTGVTWVRPKEEFFDGRFVEWSKPEPPR